MQNDSLSYRQALQNNHKAQGAGSRTKGANIGLLPDCYDEPGRLSQNWGQVVKHALQQRIYPSRQLARSDGTARPYRSMAEIRDLPSIADLEATKAVFAQAGA